MKRILSLLIVLLMTGSILVQAQFMGPQPQSGQSMNGQTTERRGRDANRSRESRVRIMIINELLLHLDVTDDQYDQMFPILRSYYESKDELTSKRMELMNTLISAIDNDSIDDEKADVDEYMKKADEVEMLSKDLLDLRADLLKRAKKILEKSQYTKLAMFDERMWRAYEESRNQGMFRIPFNSQFNNNDNNNNNNRTPQP